MSIEGPRLMTMGLDHLDIQYGASPAPPVPPTSNGDGWQALSHGTFANRTYYDMSGLASKKLTSFFQGIDIQEAFGPRGNVSFSVMDMLTTEYVTDETILAAYLYTTGDGDPPGFPRSHYNMSQVIYGRCRTFGVNTTSIETQVFQSTTWGACSATAGEKVYLTRVVFAYPTALEPSEVGYAIHLPSCDYVSSLIVGKEEDLPYLMRQKRSYEQAHGQ